MAKWRCSKPAHITAVPIAKIDEQADLEKQLMKKQLTYVQSKETREMVNDPYAMLAYIQSKANALQLYDNHAKRK